MYDSLYPESADNAMQARTLRPDAPTPPPRFSTWGFVSAAPKGLAAGAAQGAASAADVGGAIAQKMPANMVGPFGKLPVMNMAMSAFQVGADIANGPKEGQFTSEVGTSLRNVAQSYTPDAATTHVSESAVFNLFRMGSKAITAATTMGNIPGALMAGAEEGFTQADELARQGVDIKTRTKVGAVNAAVNAASFALPVAGKTWMQTGALALVGGPVSFMAQNAATREILQAADYSKLADQYDPLDPLGLALSTLIPLGFGALAMRSAKVKGKAPETMHPPEDVVDAARVSLLRNNMDVTNPTPELAGEHVKAYQQAMEQQAAGERVQVEMPEAAAVKATQDMAVRLEDVRQEFVNLDLVEAARIRQSAQTMLERGMPDVAARFNDLAMAHELKAARDTQPDTQQLQKVAASVSDVAQKTTDLQDQVSTLRTQKTETSPMQARLDSITAANPKALDVEIPMSFDEKGVVTSRTSAREYLDFVKREADLDIADAKLLEVAANCFLSG